MVKRPQGSAALVSPCWRLGIWPRFKDQSCNFPLSFVAFGKVDQMNKTKAIFRIILFLYSSFFYHCVFMPVIHCTNTFCSTAPFLFALLLMPPVPLFPVFSRFLPFFFCPVLHLSSSSPYSVSLFPLALHSSVWSPPSYSQHIRCPINESRGSKGESVTQGPRSRV